MRSLIILVLLGLSLVNVKAQSDFELGGHVGVNSSWILNQNAFKVMESVCPEDPLIIGSEPSYALTVGYTIGASAGYSSGDWWNVYTELNYTKAGQNYKDSWSGNACSLDLSAFKRNFTLHYFEIPLLLKLKTNTRKKVNGYGEIGLQFGILMGAKEKITLNGSSSEVAPLPAAKTKVKTLDLGVLLGGGAEIELSKFLYLNVGMRTYFGFLDLNKGDAEDFISDNENVYQKSRNFNASLQVGVHYVFDWIGGFYK